MTFKRESNPPVSVAVASASRPPWTPLARSPTGFLPFWSSPDPLHRRLWRVPFPLARTAEPRPCSGCLLVLAHISAQCPQLPQGGPSHPTCAVTSGSRPLPSVTSWESPHPITCLLVYPVSVLCNGSQVRAEGRALPTFSHSFSPSF